MTRVAFIEQGWGGGRNYLRNLFLALQANPAAGVQPVHVLGARSAPPADWGSLRVETVRTSAVDPGEPSLPRRALALLSGDEHRPGLLRVLRRARVDVLSHSGPLGRSRAVPSISWIPDFQHRRLPQLFTEQERARRDAYFDLMCRASSRVVVSSRAACEDLAEFHPGHTSKARVLHFVDSSTRDVAAAEWHRVAERHGIPDKFFLLPNQFWAHKNHRLVLNALALLRGRDDAPVVVATGPTDDYRNPEYFPSIRHHIERGGLSNVFRVLGTVPYEDLAAMMRRCVAIVNPSLFEGWSTSVEEAKSLGKTVVLSDIPVHREQAPRHAIFVDTDDAADLAAALSRSWEGFDPAADARRQADAAIEFDARRRTFAKDYAAIVGEVA